MSPLESRPNESQDGESQPSESESPTGSPASSSDVQLAWVAGFMDGEACIHIAKHRYPSGRSDTYRLSVSVAQNDRPVLESVCEAVGICAPIYKTKRAVNHTKQCYTLNFNGRRAMELLAAVAPHLRRKCGEAKTGLQFWVEGRMGVAGTGRRVDPALQAKREHFYQLMKSLK